jgi:hypothetical protein
VVEEPGWRERSGFSHNLYSCSMVLAGALSGVTMEFQPGAEGA